MNIQPIEKKIKKPSTFLELINVFPTIQGEGPYAGFKAIFVRLAGCNLQCPGCDTDYTSDRSKIHIKDLLKLINHSARDNNCSLIVITGGEPFRQNISNLCNILTNYGFSVQLETNGTLPPPVALSEKVNIVCSPKTGTINHRMLARANYFKYVLHADDVHVDGLPTQVLEHSTGSIVARPPLGDRRPVFLQPMDCKNDLQNQKNQDAVRDSCMKHGHILQLQIHKIVGVE